MNEHVLAYLDAVGSTDVVRARVAEIIGYYEAISDVRSDLIFMTDIVTETGVRQFDNLWLFGGGQMREAKLFLKQINLDSTPLSRPTYWAFDAESFDFREASPASRLRLRFSLPSDVSGDMRASAENCIYLLGVLRYLVNLEPA